MVAWRQGDGCTVPASGVTVVSVDYSLAPQAVYPQQVHELKGAVRWLRANGSRLRLKV
ncbi:hypothetical protein DMH04_03960 [Kibdelosporangium aridum]|uniref:Alpha/beta hydrolase fold-3 domain-containing protein n=1 Tax=Kibdelosporangium aridum TaxID=2030 RepID=A0A428ZRE3_KIBAR|nr:hypothetical protein DMH04_03960 [Kibdelosporangium aridum]